MILFAFFTEIGTPKTGLSATITVWDDAAAVAVNAQDMTEVAGGWYKYDFAGYDNTKEYVIRADGSNVLGDADRYKISSNASDVQETVDIALLTYDAPTKTEMDAAHALLATDADLGVVGGKVDAILVDTGTNIPAAFAVTDGKVDAIVDSIQGTGAITWTYTLTDNNTGLPIADADIWVTTDIAGSNKIASGKTDQTGAVTFYLDAGTVHVWSQKTGYNFTNPDTEVVS